MRHTSVVVPETLTHRHCIANVSPKGRSPDACGVCDSRASYNLSLGRFVHALGFASLDSHNFLKFGFDDGVDQHLNQVLVLLHVIVECHKDVLAVCIA